MSWLMNLWMLGAEPPEPPPALVTACVSADSTRQTIIADAIKTTISANAVREPIQAVRCGNV